jgi:phage-related protein
VIDVYSQNKTFEIKLADRTDKDGKLIPGRVMAFDTGAEMADYVDRQTPVKRKKRSKANIESRKKRAALHRQSKEARG